MPVVMTTENASDRWRPSMAWWAIGFLAVMLTAVDGFGATSLRRAIGYIGSTQQPFRDWLLYLVVMLPIFAATVLGAVCLTQRVFGGRGMAIRRVAAAFLVTVLTTIVALGQITLASVYDYGDQVDEVAQIHHLHATGAAAVRFDPGENPPANRSACTGICAGKHDTLVIHERAIRIAATFLLPTNALVVLFALALCGGQLWL